MGEPQAVPQLKDRLRRADALQIATPDSNTRHLTSTQMRALASWIAGVRRLVAEERGAIIG